MNTRRGGRLPVTLGNFPRWCPVLHVLVLHVHSQGVFIRLRYAGHIRGRRKLHAFRFESCNDWLVDSLTEGREIPVARWVIPVNHPYIDKNAIEIMREHSREVPVHDLVMV